MPEAVLWRETAAQEERGPEAVLATLRAGLEALGCQVESGKSATQEITRSVLSGDDANPEVSDDIDAFRDALGVAGEACVLVAPSSSERGDRLGPRLWQGGRATRSATDRPG